MNEHTPHKIWFLLFEEHQVLDVAGPVSIISAVNDLFPNAPPYEIKIVGERAGIIKSNSALSIIADASFEDMYDRHVDTLVVIGGSGLSSLKCESAASDFIRKMAESAQRICSICTGAYLLGSAGLLDGKRVTTHWSAADALCARFPSISMDRNAIYVVDGHIWTSAGVTSGLDMTLALVEADHGHDVAISVARRLVVYMIRPGGQAQFSVHLDVIRKRSDIICEAQSYIDQNLCTMLSIEDLATRFGMSTRNFSRRFKEEIGQSPAAFIMTRRLTRAQSLLEKADISLKCIANETGFTSTNALRRAFMNQFAVSPNEYRNRFKRLF